MWHGDSRWVGLEVKCRGESAQVSLRPEPKPFSIGATAHLFGWPWRQSAECVVF